MNARTLASLRQAERQRTIALINGKRAIRMSRIFAEVGNGEYRRRHLEVAALHRQRATTAANRIALIKSNVKEQHS